jgi:hypothetical protein
LVPEHEFGRIKTALYKTKLYGHGNTMVFLRAKTHTGIIKIAIAGGIAISTITGLLRDHVQTQVDIITCRQFGRGADGGKRTGHIAPLVAVDSRYPVIAIEQTR